MIGVHKMAIMTSGIIIVKDKSVLRGLMEKKFHPTLIEIANYIAKKYGMVITESYREPRHPGDVHSTDPVRAIDLRSWCYETKGTSEKILDDVNSRWEYDPKRPGKYKVMIIHEVDGGAIHAHVQVHPNTRFRK